MVVVELGDIDDPDERDRLLDFLAQNDIGFVKRRDSETGSVTYEAQVSLVKSKMDGQEHGMEFGSREGSFGDEEGEVRSKDGQQHHQRKIIKGQRPTQETLRMLQAFRSSREASDLSCYTHFCSLIQARQQMQPRERSLKWVLGLINDLYEERLRLLKLNESQDQDDLDELEEHGIIRGVRRASIVSTTMPDPEILKVFPVFAMDHISKRYGLRRIIDQVSWDLVFNIHAHRRQKLMVEVFARFLEEYYDDQDLIFFLRVKGIVDDLIRKSVRISWSKEFSASNQRRTSSDNNSGNQQVYLKWPEVVSIAKLVFGHSKNEQYQHFLELVDEHCVSEGKDGGAPVVDSVQLLHLAVAQYHDTRAQTTTTSIEERVQREKEQAMAKVFENAQSNYRKKLKELGFAETVANEQLKTDLGYQQRLDEMCFAIKQALLRNSVTRDSLSDVNEYTIREWAMGLLSDQVNHHSKQEQQQKQNEQEQGKQNENEPAGAAALTPFLETDGLFTRHRDRRHPHDSGPSPPVSPPPPPPPPIPTLARKEVPTYNESLDDDVEDASGNEETYNKLLAEKRDKVLNEARKQRPDAKKSAPQQRHQEKPKEEKPMTRYPSASMAQKTPTEIVMKELQMNMDRCKDAYMESLMEATEGLPSSVVLEIEKEVRSQLDKKTRQILTDVIGGGKSRQYMYDSDAVPDACSFSKLESDFKSILRVYNENEGNYYEMTRRVEQFCHGLLNTTELRQDIEPLVALLVTYASARLGNNATYGGGDYLE